MRLSVVMLWSILGSAASFSALGVYLCLLWSVLWSVLLVATLFSV